MKQEIKLGNKVEVLHGAYKGKTGTIVGMMVLDQDYADPYYDVNMDCEVEERHKCRKTMITPSNIIGGVVASDIKLISHYGGFKVGGKVRICSKASDLYGQVATVKELYPDGVGFDTNDDGHYWCHYSLVEPYTEPTEQSEQSELEEDCVIHKIEAELDELRKAQLDRMIHPEKYNSNEITITEDRITINWVKYEADLAKEVALKVANRYDDPKEAAEYAVLVAKAVVKGLKKE